MGECLIKDFQHIQRRKYANGSVCSANKAVAICIQRIDDLLIYGAACFACRCRFCGIVYHRFLENALVLS